MPRKRSLPMTRKLIQKTIDRNMTFVHNNKNERNPQIKEMVLQAMSRVEALQAVLDSLNGDHLVLRLFAGE